MKTHKNRLFVKDELFHNKEISLDKDQSHYLTKVLRTKLKDTFAIFNGHDGEWLGAINSINKNNVSIIIKDPLRKQNKEHEITLIFAPTKNCPTNFIVQKATEIGVTKIIPCITERTVIRKVNNDKLIKTAIEAAEQSNRLTIPEIAPIATLTDLLTIKPFTGNLIWCNESEESAKFIDTVSKETHAVIIGPEGGFSTKEKALLAGIPWVLSTKLTKNILRADTAAIAALTALVMHLNN